MTRASLVERYLNALDFLHRGIREKRQNRIYGMLLKEISFLHFSSALRYHQLREFLSSIWSRNATQYK